ncbi:hypothetical protein [uncultured Fluviicola sp.]|uniref:hypothetical protein n=1 Tax=uncultured Fluviicola sp. TaxID=463303 RepID=UPI0025DEE9AB|nr:hypothetical protein [uncultured Fluviicola sp.]
MKKHILILVTFLTTCKTFAQELNYCDYFTLGVIEETYEGKQAKSYWPVILKDRKDKFSLFLDEHSGRFEYILFKTHDQFDEVGNFYPDSLKIKTEFCSRVVNTAKIQNYFKVLTPKTMLVSNQITDTFSVDELMLVASRFFYCDAVNKEDTTVQSHICVGINGQTEYKSNRDLTVLEAFSYEAIFSYLTKRREPVFYKEFSVARRKAMKEQIKAFKDFDSFLIEVRTTCYNEMEHNTDLKKKLMAYYSKNRENLNFVIW